MSLHFFRRAALAFLMLALAALAHADIKLDDPIPVGPQVRVGTLANGLRYYIQRNGRPEKKLEMRLVVKAGSILEDDDQQGLAHFTEHMAFNGSTHFKKHELVSYLQGIGVKFGADLNAYTSFDETVYILPIPTEKKEHVDKAFLVLQDWAQGLSLNGADIDKERAIILEEARLGKGAADRMNKVLFPKIYNGSRYAERLPIGKEPVLLNFKHAALRRFYKDWYRPDLMAVVVVGDVDPDYAEAMVKSHFTRLVNPPHPRPRSYAPIPGLASTEAVIVTDREASANSLLIRYPVTEANLEVTFGDYREKLVDGLFAGMLNNRLQELAQQATPPFMGASSGLGKLTPRYKSFTAFAALGKDGTAPAIAALVQENARARQFGFSAAEFERARKNVMRGYERIYIERDKTDSASYAAEYIRNFLENESIPGIENEYRIVQELIPGITLDEVNRYARATIPGESQKLVVYMGSSKVGAPVPSGAQLLAAVGDAEKTVVKAQDEKSVAASLLAAPPKGGSIASETTDPRLGLTILTLSNGLKVYLKPTDFRNDQVILSGIRYGGQMLFDEADAFNARYATAIVGSMGINGYSPIDVQKILAGKSASSVIRMSPHSESVSASSGSNDIESMLQILYLQFTSSRRDEDLYKSFIGKQLEGARTAMAQPEAVFRDEVLGTLYNNHPRVGRATRPEDFSKISLERAMEVYKARFSSARGLNFVIAGSFEVEKIKPLLATYLGALPTTELQVGYRDEGVRPVKGVIKKAVHSGTEDKSSISINFTGPAKWSEQEQMTFFAMLEVLNIRITDVLREKLGLIYGGGMSGNLNRVPYEHYSIAASLPTGPQNVDKVIAATFGEIDRMKEQGPDKLDLDKVRQNWLENHRKAMRENGYWLGNIQNALMQGTDIAAMRTYEDRVRAITPAQLKEAARRYFNMQNYVQVVLYPEQK